MKNNIFVQSYVFFFKTNILFAAVIGLVGAAAPPSVETIELIVDRSFAFVIKDGSNIAFAGQFIQPESS